MNTVQLDVDALNAEATAAVDAAQPLPADVDASQQATEAAIAESWTPAIMDAMPLVRIGIFPQWDLQDDECKAFAESLGACMDQVFPGGMNGKYACWVRLIIIAGSIPATRYMVHGELPPLGPRLKTVGSNEPSKTEVVASGKAKSVATEV